MRSSEKKKRGKNENQHKQQQKQEEKEKRKAVTKHLRIAIITHSSSLPSLSTPFPLHPLPHSSSLHPTSPLVAWVGVWVDEVGIGEKKKGGMGVTAGGEECGGVESSGFGSMSERPIR